MFFKFYLHRPCFLYYISTGRVFVYYITTGRVFSPRVFLVLYFHRPCFGVLYYHRPCVCFAAVSSAGAVIATKTTNGGDPHCTSQHDAACAALPNRGAQPTTSSCAPVIGAQQQQQHEAACAALPNKRRAADNAQHGQSVADGLHSSKGGQ